MPIAVRRGGVKNICNKCKLAKYCNAACKKQHRHKHKKACEEHIRQDNEKHEEELKLAAKYAAMAHDKELFKQPLREDCPICFERMPSLGSGKSYQTCCGKSICSGCNHAPVYDDQGNEVDSKKCPFCRTPKPKTNKEVKKALHYYELGAMNGSTNARYNLGIKEGKAGNIDRALKHYMIAVRSGQSNSLEMIKKLYSRGRAPKEVYTAALQSYQVYLGEIKSVLRDKTAAATEKNRYY